VKSARVLFHSMSRRAIFTKMTRLYQRLAIPRRGIAGL
jgi:hypothetical protein